MSRSLFNSNFLIGEYYPIETPRNSKYSPTNVNMSTSKFMQKKLFDKGKHSTIMITTTYTSIDGIETNKKIQAIDSFEKMGLKDDLLRGIYNYGFEKPSAIQQRAILPIIKGRDVIAQSQSGTGKTATFCMGVLQCIDKNLRETQALILSPTRELAQQTSKVLLALGDFMNIQAHACIGGKSIGEDIRKLDAGVHVVSGTPGRVFGKFVFFF